MHTFFLPASNWQEPYQVTGPEARHLISVLRIKPGENIRLLDGEGREGIFTVTEVSKHRVGLHLQECTLHKRPAGQTTLAIGYGRGLRRGWLLEKAVELEASGIWFWQADRSQGKVPEESKETWFAQMTAGAKQSNNPWLPELRTMPRGVSDLVAHKKDFDAAYVLWEGDTKGTILRMEDLAPTEKKLFVLGPEGGFTTREITALADADFAAVSLGNRVLRWETAALLCLGLAWWTRQVYTQ